METTFVYRHNNEKAEPLDPLDLFYLAVEDYVGKCGRLPGRAIMHADWREQMDGALGIGFSGGADEVEVVYRPGDVADDRWLVTCDDLMTSLDPWRIDDTYQVINAADGQPIFSRIKSKNAYPGDILLAAAAPDLYRSLQQAVEFLKQSMGGEQVTGDDWHQNAAAIVAQATRVLVRSRGQESTG